MRSRRWWSVVGLVVVAAATTSAVAYMLTAKDRIAASTIAAGFAAVVCGAVPATAWLSGQVRKPVVMPSQLDLATAYLAEQARDFWQEEAQRRRLLGSPALVLRWSPARRRLVDRTAVPVAPGSSSTPAEVARVFRGTAGRRLVVLGEVGGGKTAWVVLLILGLLERGRPPDDAVPVFLSLGSWDPAEPVVSSAARQMTSDYPGLASVDTYGDAVAQRLITSHRVVLVLDGLDEMPRAARKEAIAALNAQLPATAPLVVTCRTSAYTAAVEDDVLQAAPAIRIDTLPVDDVVRFLLPRTGPGRWRPVLDRLEAEPDGPIARALSTPLMAALARDVFAASDPAVLIDAVRFPDREAIEDHLLDAYVRTVFGVARPLDADSRVRRWSPGKAERWLGLLAVDLSDKATSDLAWWRLRFLLPERVVGATAMRLSGLLAAVVYGILGFVESGPSAALIYALLSFYVFSLVAWPAARLSPDLGRAPRRLEGFRELGRAFLRRPATVAVMWVSAALPVGVGTTLLHGPTIGAYLAIAFGFTTALVYCMATPAPSARAISPAASFRSDRKVALTAALVIGLVMTSGAMWVGRGFATSLAIGVTASQFAALNDIAAGSAWGPFCHTRLWFALHRRMPWRLMRFLDDAHRLGVLRQVGGVYQFRHARLRDRLAEKHRAEQAGPGDQSGPVSLEPGAAWQPMWPPSGDVSTRGSGSGGGARP